MGVELESRAAKPTKAKLAMKRLHREGEKMRIRLDFRVFTVAAGMAVGLSGPVGAQTPPNQGQQPQTQSAYPTTANGLPGGSTNAQNGSVGDTMGDAQSKQMDKRFLAQVMQGSLLNIEMGKLAAEKSSNDTVKEFAKKMVADHERGITVFKKVADRDGVTLESQLDSKHKERLDKVAKLSGAEFDRAYVKDQLKAYQRMVSYYQSEADNSTESVATKMAANMLPAVQKHLNDTKDLNKNLTVMAAR
jgi:putative membrane protein